MIDIHIKNSIIHLSEDDIKYVQRCRMEYGNYWGLIVETSWGNIYLHEKYNSENYNRIMNKFTKETI